MIKIQVFGQEELIKHIKSGGEIYSHCISIVNPTLFYNSDPRFRSPELIKSSFKKTLILTFWDEEDIKNIPKFRYKRLVKMSDIKKVIKYVEDTKSEATGYTIHCWKGISRSTSIAFGLLQYFYRDEQAASEKLIDIRREAMPLKRSVKLFDEFLGSNLSDYKKTVYSARMKKMRDEL